MLCFGGLSGAGAEQILTVLTRGDWFWSNKAKQKEMR